MKKRCREVSLKSILGIDSLGIMIVFLFYVITGISKFVILALSNFGIMPVGILAILCLIAAYGILKTQKWVVWLVTIIVFPEITFAMATLYTSIMQQQTFFPDLSSLLLNLTLIIYIFGFIISTVYVLTKKQDFY